MSDPEPKAPSGADQFIDDVAHELRTPLATLAQLSEILADHLHEMSQEQVAQSLAALRRQAERANALVANLFSTFVPGPAGEEKRQTSPQPHVSSHSRSRATARPEDRRAHEWAGGGIRRAG